MSCVVVGGRGAIGSAVVSAIGQREEVFVLDQKDGIDATDPLEVKHFIDGLPVAPTRLVHVAGSVGHGGLLDTSLDQWEQTVANSLTSSYVVCREMLPGMIVAGKGAIVLMSSVNGRHGGNDMSGPAYAAAKAGVIALTQNIAKEFGPRGIRANVVAPGPVASPMTERLSSEELEKLVEPMPLGRIAVPAEIASVIAFLLSDQASYVNGAVVDVNGGLWMG